MKLNIFYVLFFLITSLFSKDNIFNDSLNILDGASSHKIVFLISPPRSLSTAFLRMMEAYQEFTIFHEPAMKAFQALVFQENNVPIERTNKTYKRDAPSDPFIIKETLISAAKSSPIFIKEMSVAAKIFLERFPEFINNPNVYFIFLVRNPHHSIISYYKKHSLENPFYGSTDFFSFICGYKSTYEIFKKINNEKTKKPLFIKSENLYTQPLITAQKVFSYLDLPFKQEALQWKEYDNNFLGKEWHEPKNDGLFLLWHDNALHSTEFKSPTKYSIDEYNIPTFSEIEITKHRPILKKIYEENKFYYDLLLAEINQ